MDGWFESRLMLSGLANFRVRGPSERTDMSVRRALSEEACAYVSNQRSQGELYMNIDIDRGDEY